ncbi:hypothetical protein TNCV_4974731 [Trichonephila clavipes]|uniref:Uncharacterized protein n=1 Tax=Trichonephila clavipes TaxID=2585209 RepID=A0A8X6SS50_TRICX|nr:hypothetical protein TNCV_4974731 [Trichonephila clavipes]
MILPSGRKCGITEKEDHRLWHTVVMDCTVSVAEIQSAIGTTVTQVTLRNWSLQGQLQAMRSVACIQQIMPLPFAMKVVSSQSSLVGWSGDL